MSERSALAAALAGLDQSDCAVTDNGVMKVDDGVARLAQMSTARLLAAAQVEVAEAGPGDRVPHLVALHERPTREVFAAAVRLLSLDDAVERELGVRILRELGRQDEAGRRPFTAEAVPLLVERLSRENDPGVLRWVISALGFNRAKEALGEVLRFTGHPDWRIRFHVAAALPGLVNPERIEPDAVEALQQLCRDDEADTRYYALYALVDEVAGTDPARIAQSVTALLDDPDEQIRALARTHHARG